MCFCLLSPPNGSIWGNITQSTKMDTLGYFNTSCGFPFPTPLVQIQYGRNEKFTLPDLPLVWSPNPKGFISSVPNLCFNPI